MALAQDQIDLVEGVVNDKLVVVQEWATKATEAAETAIDRVGAFEIPAITIDFPNPPQLDLPIEPSLGLPPDATISNSPTAVAFDETPQVQRLDPKKIPTPVYAAPTAVPDRPQTPVPAGPLDYPTKPVPALPARPALNRPVAPVIELPEKPTLLAIDIPEFVFPDIPTFTEALPQYTPPTADLTAEVRLAEYDPSALLARVNSLMEGLTPELREASRRMADEMLAGLDKEMVAKTNEAFTAWAARNFSIAPGMLIDAVNDVQEENGAKARAGMSKINNEIYKLAADNYKTAVQQGLALEKHLIDLEVEHARQLLEVEKLRVRGHLELFNATVDMFNSQQKARAVYAETYRTRLQAALRITESYKPLVDGAVAEIAENEARTQMFGAELKVVQASADVYKTQAQELVSDIELYKADLLGVKAQADIIGANISAYRDAVRAYAAGVDAASSELTAYAAQVQAVTSSAGVSESNARAYATYIQEASRGYGAVRAYVSAQGDVLRANIQSFQSAGTANEAFVRAQAAKLSGQAEIATSRAGAHSTAVRAYSTYNKALAEHNAAMSTYAMVAAENAARAQAIAAQATAETERINAGAKAAKAQAIAGLAQGAMSAMNVSATASGGANTQSGVRYSYGINESWGGNKTLSETRTTIVSGV